MCVCGVCTHGVCVCRAARHYREQTHFTLPPLHPSHVFILIQSPEEEEEEEEEEEDSGTALLLPFPVVLHSHPVVHSFVLLEVTVVG